MKRLVAIALFALLGAANAQVPGQGVMVPVGSQPFSISGTGYPTASCSNGQTFRATDTGQIWDCTDGVSVWTNRATGVTSSGAAPYNTGLLARYQMSNCTSTTIPDTSGNGNTGVFGTGLTPYFGAAPLCNSGLDIDTTTSGTGFNTGMQVNLPAAAVTGMQTFIVFAKPSGGGAQPLLNAATILTYNGAPSTYGYDIGLRAADGNPSIGNDGGSYPTVTASNQAWQGVMPVVYQLTATPHIYYQGTEVSGYAMQSPNPTVPTGGAYAILFTSAPNSWQNNFNGPAYYIETYSGVLTKAQINTETARINTELAGRGVTLGNQLNMQKPLLIWGFGTSITAGLSAGPSAGGTGFYNGIGNYVTDVGTAFGGYFQSINGGVGSNTISFALSSIASAIGPASNRWPPIVMLDAPTNDLVGGTAGLAPSVWANMVSACAAVTAAGGVPITATVLPRTSASSGSAFSSNRAAYNILVRANATTACAGFADPASDPIIGPDSAASNSTYWNSDGVHLKQAADTIAALYYESAISKASGVQPVSGAGCVSSASPATCGAAITGIIAVPTGVNPTLVVNTTAVTSNSKIFMTIDESVGTNLGVPCNSTLTTLTNPVISARTAGVSFTVQIGSTLTVNPACVTYSILN